MTDKLHVYACADATAGNPKCPQWCGVPARCLSTRDYPERMQLGYECGHRDGVEAAAVLCERLTKDSTSPHRRMAGKDMAAAIRKLKRADGTNACPAPQNLVPAAARIMEAVDNYCAFNSANTRHELRAVIMAEMESEVAEAAEAIGLMNIEREALARELRTRGVDLPDGGQPE